MLIAAHAWPSRPRTDVSEYLPRVPISKACNRLPCQLVRGLLAFTGMEAELASIKRRTALMGQRLRFGIFSHHSISLASIRRWRCTAISNLSNGSTAAAMTKHGLASITPQALSCPPRRKS